MELRQEHSEDAKRYRMQNAGGVSCGLTKLCMAYGHPFALNFGLDQCLPPVWCISTHVLTFRSSDVDCGTETCSSKGSESLRQGSMLAMLARFLNLSSLGVQSCIKCFHISCSEGRVGPQSEPRGRDQTGMGGALWDSLLRWCGMKIAWPLHSRIWHASQRPRRPMMS